MDYLRQAYPFLTDMFIPKLKGVDSQYADFAEKLLAIAKSAVKFSIPDGGKIFNDKLKGLPDYVKLPFDSIIIEYSVMNAGDLRADQIESKKRIACAFNLDADRFMVCAICSAKINGREIWSPIPFAVTFESKPNRLVSVSYGIASKTMEMQYGDDWVTRAREDLGSEVTAVLELVEALSCSNVSHTAVPRRKLNKAAARRGALPFDEYRILQITVPGKSHDTAGSVGNHRSPREHLRRGHIRRLDDTRKIWVNSCVVSVGVGGKVITSYKVST